MKDLMKRTWLRAILLSLVALLVCSGIAYAAYYQASKSLSATVAVAEVVALPSEVIGVYSDEAATTNLTSLDFGKVAAGWGWGRISATVYVKNRSNTVGPEPVKLYLNAYDSPDFNYGYVWVNTNYNSVTQSWEYPSVLPGGIIPLTIYLDLYGNAPVGNYNFTVVIQGKGVTAPELMPVYKTAPKEEPTQ